MPASPRPQLAHIGIYTRDIAKMEAFYTQVMGMIAADRGQGMTFKNEFVFLTGSPDQHHQLVLLSGRAPEGPSNVNQISFKLRTLAELRAMHERLGAAGIEKMRPVSHGNALSIYFDDPEGNGVEVYMDTPWHIPQPFGTPLDFTRSNEEIWAETEARCRATPGFKPMAERTAEMATRLEKA
jgi:catechol 2,3-dioxygenase